MSNTFFRFKQFTVHQDKCAMKVCTDACLFGAWVAEGINKNPRRALDIGAGTGVLSLMFAQKNNTAIDAVEIEKDAAVQAAQNAGNSPWANVVTVTHSSIRSFDPGYKYDVIFSNPPFYENDLKSNDPGKNIAHHGTALKLDELLLHIKRLLSGTGSFALLMPFHRENPLEKLAAEQDFFLIQKVQVRQTTAHAYFRTMYLFSNQPGIPPVFSEITIRDANNQYTPLFENLLSEYYLFEKTIADT